ncbi:MAG TPA: NADP-dependent malic enzyme [Thermoplasmataceae archaeon]|nr:NADP-dependent malic enzyme [Thermoplasmatales archaeon AK]HLH86450.1 NADP-dependent malic enzyme [Thermoplasmataceae archaeon]
MDDVTRTEEFNKQALIYSDYYKGKVQIIPKVPVRNLSDFSVWYTPGVAAVSTRVAQDPEASFELTGRWNTIAILTDGTRVLGLGNIGPEGAMPVMEGKSLIFNFLGAVNAVPLPIRVNNKDEFIAVAKALEPSFGGYNLEDIESPKCFFILETLQKSLKIPAWHDDQLGTACITLAGLINSLRVVGKRLEDSRVVLLGSGAANIAAAHLLIAAGAREGNIILADSKGVLEPERDDMDQLMINNPWKYNLALRTNSDRIKGPAENAFKGSDVVVSAAKPGPGTIKPEWIRTMNDHAIVFALANPVPEIWPEDAKEAGAEIVATGRGDFPNQINNSLVFPGVFRGVLDARSKGVNFDVMVAASKEIADFIDEPTEDRIVPTMEDWELYPRVASAVAYKTSEIGLARRKNSKEGFYKAAHEMIESNRNVYLHLMREKYIRELPGVNKIER